MVDMLTRYSNTPGLLSNLRHTVRVMEGTELADDELAELPEVDEPPVDESMRKVSCTSSAW